MGTKDSSGDLALTTEYIRHASSDSAVLMGRDTLIFAGLLSDASGAIAATANVVPGLVAEIYDAFQAGDFARARTAQNRLPPLCFAFEMGTFPSSSKRRSHSRAAARRAPRARSVPWQKASAPN